VFSSKKLKSTNHILVKYIHGIRCQNNKKIAGSENKMANLLSRNCTEVISVEHRIICSVKNPCQICKGSSETLQCGAPPSDANERVVQHMYLMMRGGHTRSNLLISVKSTLARLLRPHKATVATAGTDMIPQGRLMDTV
jgi:hypothetical protein